MMNRAMGSMMGWMMGFGWLAALLIIILLVIAIIALVRGMTQTPVAEKKGAGNIVMMVFAVIGVLILVGVLAMFLMHGGMMGFGGRSPATSRDTAGGFALRLRNPPMQIADFAFEDASGNKHSLANFRGRYVLLNVWATWCVPCRKEMPALARLQQKLGGPDFEVVALSVDSAGADAVKRFFAELRIDALKVYVDRSLQSNAVLSVVGYPTTVLIDPHGREIGRAVGPADWDGAEALDAIRRLTAGNQLDRRVADGKST